MRIYLPNGISPSALQKIRDTVAYIVLGQANYSSPKLIVYLNGINSFLIFSFLLRLEKPSHGVLSEYFTSSDSITYTPDRGPLEIKFSVFITVQVFCPFNIRFSKQVAVFC